MSEQRARTYLFNKGKSQVCLRYGPINQAWFVFRQDDELQGALRVHLTYVDALADYERRVEFSRRMDEALV